MTSCSPDTRLYSPSPALAGCIRTYICRSTIGMPLTASERCNAFPPYALCVLTWYLTGGISRLVVGAEQMPVPAAPVVFTGPMTVPHESYNDGPIHRFTVAFLPDALQKMTGLPIDEWVNRVGTVEEALGPSWARMAASVASASTDSERIAVIEAFVSQQTPCDSTAPHVHGRRFRDWARWVAGCATSSGSGRSARQAERRLRRWTGLPLRALRSLSNVETVLLELNSARHTGRVNWSAFAADTGHADQSHLCRFTRRSYGETPGVLLKRIESDERFWIYRLWR